MNELHTLAAWATGLTFAGLPPDIVDRARRVIRDTVGAILGGMAEPEHQALANHAGRAAPGPVALWGTGARTTAAWAALVHGTAGVALEMDEGHAFARGHAAIHAVPTALALGEAGGASGAETLTAAIVGYEVAARAGVATRLRHGVHPFGTWGVLGAAAVGAWFRGFDAGAMAGVLELAAAYAITPTFESAFQGANVRNSYVGVVNRLGLLAVELYDVGFRGETGATANVFGQILGQRFAPEALVDGLGERYEISRGYFKPYSACRYTHAAVDAVLGLREEVPGGAVDHIDVDTYDIAATLRNPAPATPLAGRFSVPYVVAATLLHGSAGPEIFTPDVLEDPAVLDLAGRVRLREDPELTAMTPARRPARITVHLSDGTSRTRMVTGARGDPDQPLTAEELHRKFMQLAGRVLPREQAAAAWDALGQIDSVPEIENVTSVLNATAS